MIKNPIRKTAALAPYAWLLAFALLLQGLMPPGYMPDFSRRQLFAITICTGSGHIQIKAPLGPKPHGGQQDNTPCTFAANPLATFGGLPIILLALIILSFTELLFTLPDFGLSRLRIYGNASSRAPPISP